MILFSPSCLDKFKARHEASLASGAAKLTKRPSSQGESSTPTQELPLTTWPQPPSTPTLKWWEVDEKVAEVMDEVHNLHLKTVQEMGFIQEIDQALSKSLMVEFLRLKLITGDDLSTTLRTWQADMEATTEEFLRDQTTSSMIIFVQIQESSQVIPLPGVPTLFLDVKITEDITDSKKPRSPQDFRGFKLHRVVYTGVSPPIRQVALPHLQGKTVFHWKPLWPLGQPN